MFLSASIIHRYLIVPTAYCNRYTQFMRDLYASLTFMFTFLLVTVAYKHKQLTLRTQVPVLKKRKSYRNQDPRQDTVFKQAAGLNKSCRATWCLKPAYSWVQLVRSEPWGEQGPLALIPPAGCPGLLHGTR